MNNDPVCECGDLYSQHVDGEAQCFIPECGCKNFVAVIQDEREFSPKQETTIEKLTEPEDHIQPLMIGDDEYAAWNRTVNKINELVAAVNELLKAASLSRTFTEE